MPVRCSVCYWESEPMADGTVEPHIRNGYGYGHGEPPEWCEGGEKDPATPEHVKKHDEAILKEQIKMRKFLKGMGL